MEEYQTLMATAVRELSKIQILSDHLYFKILIYTSGQDGYMSTGIRFFLFLPEMVNFTSWPWGAQMKHFFWVSVEDTGPWISDLPLPLGWAILNLLKAWTEQGAEERGTDPFFIAALLELGHSSPLLLLSDWNVHYWLLWFWSLWTWTELYYWLSWISNYRQ